MKSHFYMVILCFLLFFSELICLASPIVPLKTLSDKRARVLPGTKTRYKTEYQTDDNLSAKAKNKNIKLTGTQDNTSSLWSNAFNFHKNWSTQVDPRTGSLSARIKVGSMISNLGHGPNIELEITYGSTSSANQDQLGIGWSWNLTHFNLLNNQLSTSQGQTFNLQEQGNGQWWPHYHKLQDIQIGGSKETHFVITYANGLRETLNHEGFETKLEQQNGWSVNFSYTNTHLLSKVSDNLGHEIVLLWKNGYINITSYDSEGKPQTIHLDRSDSKLDDIVLPGNNNRLLPNISLAYMGHLLSQITYPTGLKERMEYNCINAMREPLQNNNQSSALCAVVLQSVDPGAGQPVMTTSYTYDQSSANEHNFLGFNAGLSPDQKSMQDILFEAPADYTYKTTKDNKIIRQINTYDKYHLLIDTQFISDRSGDILTETQNFFCRTDEIDGCANTSFKDLPDTYSLPLKTVTKTWGKDHSIPSTKVTEKIYDTQGRVIRTQDAYGRVQETSYCPAMGDASCPAEPTGWSLSTPVESVTSYPSYQVSGASLLPVITTHSYYQKLPNISNHGYILALARKIVHSGDEQTTTTCQYYCNSKNMFSYGLPEKTIQTGTVSPDAGFTSVTKVYHYNLSTDHHTKTTYNTVELSNGHLKRSPVVTTSMFTNQVLKSTNASGQNIIRYYYDHWGRVIKADSGVGTSFAVSKQYQYTISPRQLQLIITASNGLQQKIIFDGGGRQLATFNEAISSNGKAEPGKWLPIKSTSYDAYGRIMHEYTYHVDSSDKTNKLETTFFYDDFGRIIKKKLPDGISIINDYDDPDHCVVNFKYDNKRNRSFITITHRNMLDDLEKQVILPADFNHDELSARQLCTSNTLSTAKVSTVIYDGFGREIKSVDPMGRTITKVYDSLGHVTGIIDPRGDEIRNVYNLTGQIIQKWALPVNTDKQYLLASSRYNEAGELLWKAGEDGKKTLYNYTPDGQLASVTTPAGHTIAFKYNAIGLPISEVVDGKQLSYVEYNHLTTLPVKMTEATGITTWIYSDDKKKQQLIHTGTNGYPDYHFMWQYDQNRNIISITDLAGNRVTTDHDVLGRIQQVNYQTNNGEKELIMSPVYDGFSRTIAIKYGSGMQRTIHYNSYGQTSNISDLLSGKQLSAWQYSYDKDGDIISMIRRTGDDQQAVLHYQYDMLDNLLSMTCTGSPGLPLCPRDTSFRDSGLKQAPVITSQRYTFNALNRIAGIKEMLISVDKKETLSKTVNYNYNDAQTPLRLKQISTTWNDKAPVTADFIYDMAGNMMTDSGDNHITYNAFNQITKVTTPEGKQTGYFYDSNGREIKEVFSDGNSRNLFYMGKMLMGEKVTDEQQGTHIISNLGIAKAVDGVIHEYYEDNYKGDVTGILTKKTSGNIYTLSQRNIYSPYGMIWHTQHTSSLPWYQQALAGFDGEQADPATGWQFLGAGNRTYNPEQRYFVSEDPAGNGYAFGSNNPMMNTDPTGNISKSLKEVMQAISYSATLGLGLEHKKWANILGVSLVAALTAVVMAACLYATAPVGILLAAAAALSADANIVGIAYISNPDNKALLTACYAFTGAAIAFGIFRMGWATYMQGGKLLASIGTTAASSDAEISGAGAALAETSDAGADFHGEPEPAFYDPEASESHLAGRANILTTSDRYSGAGTMEAEPSSGGMEALDKSDATFRPDDLNAIQEDTSKDYMHDSLRIRDSGEYSQAQRSVQASLPQDRKITDNRVVAFFLATAQTRPMMITLQAGAVHSVYNGTPSNDKVPLLIFRYLSNYATIFYIFFYQFATSL